MLSFLAFSICPVRIIRRKRSSKRGRGKIRPLKRGLFENGRVQVATSKKTPKILYKKMALYEVRAPPFYRGNWQGDFFCWEKILDVEVLFCSFLA